MSNKGLKVDYKDDTYHLNGSIDEYANYDALKDADAPLKMNLSGISRLNSMGIRGLLGFLRDWGQRPYEFYECSVDFVSQVNLIPALLQLGAKKMGKIQSLKVPFHCEKCDTDAEEIFETSKLESDPESMVRECPKCKGEMSVTFDGYFDFCRK